MKDKNRPACYAPWITTYDLATGDIVPCCEYQTKCIENPENKSISLQERFDHPKMNMLKTQLMKYPILPPGCINCTTLELHNGRSLRQEYDEQVKLTSKYKWDQDKFTLLYMDYRESNICNFSCKMCGTDSSSTHAKIEGVYGKTGIIKNPHKLQEYLDRLDEVECINFAGGEPLLMNSTWDILKEIQKRDLAKDMYVSIVTNGSLLHRENNNLTNLLTGFMSVDISISIDAVGEQHNYWRHKNTWETVKENCDKLYKWKHKMQNTDNNFSEIKLCTRTAIGWPNAYAARDVFDMFKDVDDIHQKWNLITAPSGLNIKNLPQEELDKLAEYWNDYPEIANVFNTVSKSNRILMAYEKLKIMRHDAYHKNSFVLNFPEWTEFYNYHKIPTLYRE